MLFVKVAESENDESVEIPVEPDGHILMSTLTAQFPSACGLKFKTEQSSWRGVRVVDDKLFPPGDDKWDTCVYIVTFPKDSKRKGEDLDVNTAKSRKIERKCVDLIVLGIPWKSTEDVVRRYFEQFGEVVLCEIKRDASNNSKGFGFVRFKDYNSQCSVLGKKHFIDGRWCDVKIPNSQEPETSRKIFVGRLSENLTSKDLQEYFAQYGQVIDVYIPKPFRAFGFVTFVEADIAQSLCGESHIIKGVSVHVSKADPKEDENGGGGGGHHMHGGGMHHPNNNHHNNHHYNNNNNMNHNHHHSNSMNNFGHHGHHGGGAGRNDNGGGSGGGGGPRRFNMNNNNNNNGHHGSMSHHHIGSLGNGGGGMMPNNNNGMGGGPPNSKSMGSIRNKMAKYAPNHGQDNHHQDAPYGESNNNNNRNDRSPIMPQSMSAHHLHANNNNVNGGGPNNNNNTNNSNDPMNAMMTMFNPMMQAFIQQLASGIQPQSPLDGGPGQGNQQQQQGSGLGGGGGHPYGGYNQGGGGGHRFKAEKF